MQAPQNIKGLVNLLIGLINPAILVLVALSLLVFFRGLAIFIFKVGGDVNAGKEGKELMKWGLIALFVMVSLWGILTVLFNTLWGSGGLAFPLLPTKR